MFRIITDMDGGWTENDKRFVLFMLIPKHRNKRFYFQIKYVEWKNKTYATTVEF